MVGNTHVSPVAMMIFFVLAVMFVIGTFALLEWFINKGDDRW